jgi:hypothetical protein
MEQVNLSLKTKPREVMGELLVGKLDNAQKSILTLIISSPLVKLDSSRLDQVC